MDSGGRQAAQTISLGKCGDDDYSIVLHSVTVEIFFTYFLTCFVQWLCQGVVRINMSSRSCGQLISSTPGVLHSGGIDLQINAPNNMNLYYAFSLPILVYAGLSYLA